MLSISGDKRRFIKDGSYFPYIADTAWTLLQRLTRQEIIQYLDKRVSQGFNAIQVSAISELDGVRIPNREGQLPFENENVSSPCGEYFSLLTFLAVECQKRDIVLTLLPTWGDKFNKKWGTGPEIFTPENSFGYGRFLAEKMADFENVIWMLGGDRPIDNERHRAIIDNMAAGIRAGEKTHRLMTYHPPGEKSSADYLCGADYIDFHTVQSSHGFGGFESEKYILKTLKRENKPCIEGECAYEDIPLELNADWQYRFCAREVRSRVYRDLLAGAAGIAYGHQSVWCFKDSADGEYPFSWRDALERPGANQIRHVKTFLSLFNTEEIKPLRCEGAAYAASNGEAAAVYLGGTGPAFLNFKKDMKERPCIFFNPLSGEIIREKRDIKKKTVLFSPFEEDALFIIG